MKTLNFFQKAVILGLIFFSSIVSGQVGINSTGSNPDPSAGLDVNFSDLGLLIPRVSLTSTTDTIPIAAYPATGLLVYNTATANDVTPGFYYWNGSSWVRFATIANGASDAWTITGNTGTTAGTNFLGTTDNQALDIRTNNAIRMRITSAGNVGIGTTTPGMKLDVIGDIRSNREIISTFSPGAVQFRAVAVHYGLMLRNDGSSTYFLLTDYDDQYGGWNALRPFRIENASGNVHLGNSTLFVQHGGNVGIGTTSPTQKLDVNGNTRLRGYVYDYNNSSGTSGQVLTRGTNGVVWQNPANVENDPHAWKLTGNTGTTAGTNFLGTTDNQALDIRTNDTIRMRITSAGNVGIGTTAPGYKFDVQGTGRYTGTLTIGAYTLPNTDGSANYVLKTNGTGTVSWQADAIGSGTVTSISAGTPGTNTAGSGLTFSVNPITSSGSIALSNTGVSAGTYTNANITVDAQGRITSASSGNSGVTMSCGTNNYVLKRGSATSLTCSQIFDNGTNVGIGTTSPTQKLDVSGNTRLRGYIYDYNNSSGTSGQLLTRSTNGVVWQNPDDVENDPHAWKLTGNAGTTAGTNFLGTTDNQALDIRTNDTIRMRITSAGNVGIGTTTPGRKLDVTGDIRSSREIISTLGTGSGQFRAIASNYGIMLRNDGGNTYFLLTASNDQYGGWNALRPFRIENATGNVHLGNSTLFVQHGGNVGIGTTGPSYKLDVNGTIRAIDFGSAGSQNIIVGDDAYLTDIDQANFLGIYGASNSDRAGIRLGSDGSYIFGDNGNVGIGTTSPAQKLDVAGNVKFSGALMPNGNAGTAGQVLVSQGAGNPPVWQNSSAGGPFVNQISNQEWTGVNWQTCFNNCLNLTEGGHTDWRMPTIEEIQFYRNVFSPPDGSWINDYVWSLTRFPSTSTDFLLINEFTNECRYYTATVNYSCRCIR